jgi:hypothetical protein
LRRSISLLAGAAIAGALVIFPVAHAPLAHAQSGECASFPGYEQIEAENTGMYVDGQGGGNPVRMEPVGSCYKPTAVGTITAGGYTDTVYTYYNQDDRCLYWNTDGAVYTAVNANGCAAQPNEEFVGIRPVTSVGWLWYNIQEYYGEGVNDQSNIYGYPCTNGGLLLTGAYSDVNSCDYWNFPSDGG